MPKRDLRDKLVVPIVVNLTTALIIFVAVVIFKEPIYKLLGPEAVERYPIYVVAEPYTDEHDGLLKADLFIINLTGDEQSESDLLTFLKISTAQDNDKPQGPDIAIKWNDDLGKGKITSIIEPQTEFNEGKGKLEIQQPTLGDEAWGIRIRELRPKAIMRLVVATDYSQSGVDRTSKFFSPITVDYPGE